jgi:hypothetical protein
MTTATDREYLDSLAASCTRRLNGKANLKRTLLILLIVTLTVLSLLELHSSVTSSKMLLKGKADLKRLERKYRCVIGGSYRVRSGMHTVTIKQRVICTRKLNSINHTPPLVQIYFIDHLHTETISDYILVGGHLWLRRRMPRQRNRHSTRSPRTDGRGVLQVPGRGTDGQHQERLPIFPQDTRSTPPLEQMEANIDVIANQMDELLDR